MARRHRQVEGWREAMETRKAELLNEARLLEEQAAQIEADMPEVLRLLELAEKNGLTVTRVIVDEQSLTKSEG